MQNNETWDDRYDLMNKAYLRYGVIIIDATPFNAGVDSADAVILASGGAGNTINLPLAADKPHAAFYIKKIGAGPATDINRSGADLIDGQFLLSLPVQYDSVLLVSDGLTNWYVLAKSNGTVLPVT